MSDKLGRPLDRVRGECRVCLVCCDLRRPRLNLFFGLPNGVGFTSMLLHEASKEDAVQAVQSQKDLFVLTSGPLPPNPSEVLASEETHGVFAALLEEFDVVLVDSPPVLPVTDALVLSGVVASTILVASNGETSKRALHRAVELLAQVNAPVLGVVLNRVADEGGYSYTYQQQAPPPSPSNGSRSDRRRRGSKNKQRPVGGAWSEVGR